VSQFPASFDLTGLNGSDGFALEGEGPADLSGCSVASAGDVNGRRLRRRHRRRALRRLVSQLFSGAAYVVFGKASGERCSVRVTSRPHGREIQET
jgi:hypothetical protein